MPELKKKAEMTCLTEKGQSSGEMCDAWVLPDQSARIGQPWSETEVCVFLSIEAAGQCRKCWKTILFVLRNQKMKQQSDCIR